MDEPRPDGDPADSSPATLLVVDDNEENRDMLSRRLERRGYRVLRAEDGEAALATVASESVDLILLDVMMPGIDGLEVLQRVRQEHSSAELPVIMATARDQSEDVVKALDLGANDYVTKPIDFAVVQARVQKELRTKVARRDSDSGSGEARRSGDLGAGSLLAGRYRLDEVVGKGNFGVVYKGHHLELDMPVAIKLLHAQVAGAEALQRFRSEGRSSVRIRHPNAVTVYDFGVTDEGVAFLIMELLEGESLTASFKRAGKLDPVRVNVILQPVCEVLQDAHDQGIVHRDVKPENVYLQNTSQGEVVKVLDFGIAKLVGEHVARENLTAEGFVLGTPAYMAPERLRNHVYDGQSDVYSLGIMLFQLLAGRLPFLPDKSDPMALLMMHLKKTPPKLRSFSPELPEEFEDLIQSCLAKQPEGRPTLAKLSATFAELASTLAPAAPQQPSVDQEALTTLMPSADSPEISSGALGADPEGWLTRFWRKLVG
ncbi:MAG: protein kinase [Acidobacteriota bacterium]